MARRAGGGVKQGTKMCCMEARLVTDQHQHPAGGTKVRRCQQEAAADPQPGCGILYLDGAQSGQLPTEGRVLRRQYDKHVRMCLRRQARCAPQQ